MRGRQRPESEAIGTDSFLDIVANMVGIVIILVMVVGMRVRNLPEEDSTRDEQPSIDLSEPSAIAARLQADVLRLAAQADQLAMETALRFEERSRLAVAVAAREQELSEAHARLGDQQKEDLERSTALAAADAEVDRLAAQLQQLDDATKSPPKKIETFPTPLSKTVNGREIHVQLRGRRITHIPVDRLVEEVKADFQRKAGNLRSTSAYVGSVGPVGGFQMRYMIERVGSTAGGTLVGVTQWQLIPTSPRLGETLEEALSPHSELRMTLAALEAKDTTITLWVYPDSFDIYRDLRKELYRAGYQTAGRPLPDGILIGASPLGTKSAAQ